MKSFNVTVDGRHLEIKASRWSGREVVTLDGEIVSDKRSYSFIGIHSFKVKADVWEVVILSGWFGANGYAVRVNGVIQAHT